MKIAVLSLTRDRLWSTQHCFATLRDLAGCDFDHYVLDQASEDGTAEWLAGERDAGRLKYATFEHRNMGISIGMNHLLDAVSYNGDYDVVVKYDNDCELLEPGTLKVCCEVALDGWIASPHIQGLNSPPSIEYELDVLGYACGVPNLLGGIFMAAPASLYDSYRHDPANPVWGLDDAKIVDHWRAAGNEVCYLLDYPANHYLSTEGQAARDPLWYERKVREFHQ